MEFKEVVAIVSAHIRAGERERKLWDRWHSWYLSEFWDAEFNPGPSGSVLSVTGEPESEVTLETNFPYAFIDTMIANVCPTNPMITLTGRQQDLHDVARARENLVNDTLRRDKMHAKSWDMATYAGICGRAFSKTVWSKERRRPITRVIPPRNVFYDHTCDYEDAAYIFEAVPMRKRDFLKRVKSGEYNKEAADMAKPGRLPSWLVDQARGGEIINKDAPRDAFDWVVVIEFYNLADGELFVLLEDSEIPLAYSERPPFLFVKNPFSMLIFNKNLRDNSGISDVKLIARIQERLNEIDTLELMFAHSTIPVTMMDEAAVDDPEGAVDQFAKCSKPGDIVRVKVTQGKNISDVFTWTQSPGLAPSHEKMRDRCTSLCEFILGIPNYARGVVGQADVATELALADTATRTRNGRRIRCIEDWVVDVARKSLGLWREFLDSDTEMLVRDRNTFGSTPVDRPTLGFGTLDADEGGAKLDNVYIWEDSVQFEDEWFYDFEAVPYSPTENHKLVQLQKLQQFIEVLHNNPMIDQLGLYRKLTELIGMSEIVNPSGGAQAMPGAPGAAPAQDQAGGMPTGTSADNIATGALPAGEDAAVAAIMPPGASQLASPPMAK